MFIIFWTHNHYPPEWLCEAVISEIQISPFLKRPNRFRRAPRWTRDSGPRLPALSILKPDNKHWISQSAAMVIDWVMYSYRHLAFLLSAATLDQNKLHIVRFKVKLEGVTESGDRHQMQVSIPVFYSTRLLEIAAWSTNYGTTAIFLWIITFMKTPHCWKNPN